MFFCKKWSGNFNQRWKSTTVSVVILALFAVPSLFAQYHDVGSDGPDWTWRVFGEGFCGGSAIKRRNEISVDANWSKASWGLGIVFLVELTEPDRELDHIRVEIKALNATAKVYAGLTTQTGGNKMQKAKSALTITNTWRTFQFSTASMKPTSADNILSTIDPTRLDNTQAIHLFFLKPNVPETKFDTIVVRNLIVTFTDGESYAYQRPY